MFDQPSSCCELKHTAAAAAHLWFTNCSDVWNKIENVSLVTQWVLCEQTQPVELLWLKKKKRKKIYIHTHIYIYILYIYRMIFSYPFTFSTQPCFEEGFQKQLFCVKCWELSGWGSAMVPTDSWAQSRGAGAECSTSLILCCFSSGVIWDLSTYHDTAMAPFKG